jgi:hypothetical protein
MTDSTHLLLSRGSSTASVSAGKLRQHIERAVDEEVTASRPGSVLLVPHDAGEPEITHESCDPVAADLKTLATELAPHPANTVHAEVVAVDPLQLGLEAGVLAIILIRGSDRN